MELVLEELSECIVDESNVEDEAITRELAESVRFFFAGFTPRGAKFVSETLLFYRVYSRNRTLLWKNSQWCGSSADPNS